MGNFENIDTIVLVGMGLIGGSILKGIKDSNYQGNVYGLDQEDEVIEHAFDKGLIKNKDKVINPKGKCLILFCVPALSFEGALKDLQSYDFLPQETIYTDTFSAKTRLLEFLEANSNLKKKFVVGHPIAGSEKSGIKNSSKDLFKDKLTLISPFEENSNQDISVVKSFWDSLGSRVLTIKPNLHDIIFARTSHLPHIISYSLMHSLIHKLGHEAFEFSGGSLEDYTRTSSSDPRMWKDVTISNKEEILSAIDDFISSLNIIKSLISQDNEIEIEKFLREIKLARDSLIKEDS